ncbi:MAG: type I methionyl aminopeptidase [Candidatus Nealsonbacteria bacterium]
MITIKSEEEIKIMREGGKILAQIIKELEGKVKPGITTNYLDKVASDLVFKYKAEPSFKGYQGFPAVLCTSINEEIVHTAPSERELKDGDIISLDLGIFYKGFHSDMAITVPVGDNVDSDALRLIKVTKKALKRGIRKTRADVTLGDIGNTIQRYVEDQGYGIVRDLCGHGIGKDIHEDPQVLNYGKRKTGLKLKIGMVICIEPMVTMGDYNLKKAKDGFSYITKDNSLSAHFEHTMAVTQNGCQVLTEL